MKRLAPAARLTRWLHRASYLRKWLFLGTVIGIVAGLGALAFTSLLELATRFFLGTLAGAKLLSPLGEGGFQGAFVVQRPWAIPLVVGLGGLISGILVFRFAPEAEGHGTDAAIGAVHHDPTGIRPRVSLVKLAASAVTIGSGGSGGREGPTAQISAGFASFLARTLELGPADARLALTVGISAGIGAIFRAPLGGAVLGAEILYRDDAEIAALIPSAIASIIGFAIFGSVKGFIPIFGFLSGYHFHHPVELGFYLLLGVCAGLVGRLYAASFYGTVGLTRRVPGATAIKPAVAGVIVGLMGLALPAVLGTGYGWVQKAMGPALLTIPLWVVLILPFAKIAATSLSIGSGGSGGIFGPGMVIGGFLGAGLWRLLEPMAPGVVPHSPAPFVIVGMVACFGSIAHAPLAVLLMVAEMTGSLELMAPATIAVALAALVVGEATIYTSQLKDKSESVAQRVEHGLPLLHMIPMRDALTPASIYARPEDLVADVNKSLQDSGFRCCPVVDGSGRYVGSFPAGPAGDAPVGAPVSDFIDEMYPSVAHDDTLASACEVFASADLRWLPVLDLDHNLVGIVTWSGVLGAYRRHLERDLRRLGGTFQGADLDRMVVDPGSTVAGRALGAVLPRGVVVLSIQRGEHRFPPSEATSLEAGDSLDLVGSAAARRRFSDLLAAPPGQPGDGEVGRS